MVQKEFFAEISSNSDGSCVSLSLSPAATALLKCVGTAFDSPEETSLSKADAQLLSDNQAHGPKSDLSVYPGCDDNLYCLPIDRSALEKDMSTSTQYTTKIVTKTTDSSESLFSLLFRALMYF